MSEVLQEAWPTATLGEYSEFKNGINFTKAQKGKVGVPTIDVKNMYGHGFAAGVDKLYRVDKDIKDDYFLRKGDLLFVRSSLKQEGIGWTAQFVTNSEPTTYCGFIIRARLNDQDTTDPSFLTFYFRSDDARRALIASSGKVAITNISQGILSKAPIPLPPLPEQKKIAHILSTVQRAIEAQERIIQTTTELKKALMHQLFTEGLPSIDPSTGGLRNEPQKQTEIGPIPESWEVVKLSDCAVVQTGIAKGRKVDPKEAVEVPYLRVANVQDGYLDLSEMKTITIRKAEEERFALQEGDVVLTEGGDFDKLGRGFIWHGQVDRCVHQNHVFAVRPDTKQISSEFFAYQSQSPYGKAYFLVGRAQDHESRLHQHDQAQGISRPTAVKGATKGHRRCLPEHRREDSVGASETLRAPRPLPHPPSRTDDREDPRS